MSSLLGLGGILTVLWYVFTNEADGFGGFFDKSSLIFLGVLPPSVIMLSHTISDFLGGVRVLLGSFFSSKRRMQLEVINTVSQLNQLMRSDGIAAIMPHRRSIKYDLLKDGVSMIVNDFSAAEIRHNLMAKINSRKSKNEQASFIFEKLAKICPAVGMIGTLLGLIKMMSALQDPKTIGAGMALALVTTLYGLLLGTLIYGPCSEKIGVEGHKMLEIDLLVLESTLLLKNRKSSLHLSNIVNTYSNAGRVSGNKKSS